MKKAIILFSGLLLCGIVNAQQTINEDAKARIGTYLKLNQDIYNVYITSSEAKAIVDVITNAFDNYFIIPDIPMDGISSSIERSEILSLKERLNNLLENPPTWDFIAQYQRFVQALPPTPPIYSGDEKVQHYYNSKNSNASRISGVRSFENRSSITSKDETKVPQPKSE